LSENFDRESREIYIEGGVTPMQGFDRGLDAIAMACKYHQHRTRILGSGKDNVVEFRLLNPERSTASPVLMNEWDSKRALVEYGVRTPRGELLSAGQWQQSPRVAAEIGFPVALKLVAEDLAHKTEYGVVALSLDNEDEVRDATQRIQDAMLSAGLSDKCRGLLVESMLTDAVYELLVGIQHDAQFGLTMVIAGGGILVELYRDSVTLLLPVSASSVRHALSQLKCYPVLEGYRGKPGCDVDAVVADILKIADFAADNAATLVEMDVNPLIVLGDGAVAADALVRIRA
jgi:acyl-CoA synthetase (NDP forming)